MNTFSFDIKNLSNRVTGRANFKQFGKGNVCSVCGREDSDCRYNANEPDFIQCHHFADARKGEKVNSFVCIKESNGHTASFKPDSSQEWTEQRRREWEQCKAQRERLAQQQERLRRERSLSAGDRHNSNSEILDSCSQDETLIIDLQQRSFTPEEIANCEFKSVKRYQELPRLFDKRLPGVTEDGRRLIVSGDGYLCPMRDYDGHIVALQIRLHNPGEGGRYRYVSSPEQTLAIPIGDALENPLAVFHPAKPKGIALVEGVGAKPFLTSNRLNLLTIGAPGGQFVNSPNLLSNYLNRALAQVGGNKKLVIFPDAGDPQNRQVLNRWKKLAELLNSLGWDFQFGWWNQLTKNDADIDELNCVEYSKIQYICAKEFFKIANLQLKQVEQEKQAADKAKEKSNEIEQKAQASNEEWHRLNAVRHKLLNITEVPYKVVNVAHMKEVLPSLIQPGTTNIIISDAGTGKSESVAPVVAQSEAAYSWHNRVSLERAMGETLGIASKNAANGLKKNVKKASFCTPSSPQFAPGVLRNQGVLLVDEADQVFDFNFGSLCNKDGVRPLILSTLESHIEATIYGKGIALFMSADITQKDIDYIKQLAPEGTPVRVIINKYQPPKGTIHHDISPNPFGQLNKLVEKLQSGIPCFALDDMKNGVKGCKSLAQYIRELMPEIADKVLEIHADNSNDQRVKDLFSKPDEEAKKYLLIICSPSVVSGISLKEHRFVNGVFGFCNGILMDREIKQFLNRIRGAKDIYLWVDEEGFAPRGIPTDAITPEQIKEYYQRNYNQNSKHILSFKPDYNPMKDEWESPHFELMCKNLADRLICAKRLRDFTIQHLTEIGYKIVEVDHSVTDTATAKKQLEKAWTNIEIGEAEAIAAARILSEAEMEALEYSREGIPPELLPSWKKTRMLQTFGEELIEATKFHHKKANKDFTSYAAMALKNSRGDYQKQLDNFWLLSQEANEAIARDYAAEARQLKHGHGRFPSDTRQFGSARKCREFLGLKEFLNPDKWWQPNDYREKCDQAKKYAGRIKEVLGFNCENISPGQIFGELMRQIGISFETQAVKGAKWKLRRINQDDWNYCQMYVQHRESLKVSEAVETVTEVSQVDPIPTMLSEQLVVSTTRKQCEELFSSVTEQQKNQAWAMLSQEQQDRIYKLFEVQVVQPTIFEQVVSQESIESVDIKIEITTEQAITTDTFDSLTVSPAELAVTLEDFTMKSEQTPSSGSKCWVWYYSRWLKSVIKYWEHDPSRRFFKAVVDFVDGGSLTIWQRECIQLFEEVIA